MKIGAGFLRLLPVMLIAHGIVASADDPKMPTARELFSDQPKGLSEHVAAWKFSLWDETFGNTMGGLREGAIFEGMAKFGVAFNLDKLVGWKDASFYVNAIYPFGDSLSLNRSGDFNDVSNLDTFDSLRLYKLWFQKLFDDGKWSLRFGQIAADKECFVSDGASLYLNNAFGTFPVFSSNIPGPIFPLSAPGVRVRYLPDDEFSILAMVFSGNVGTPTSNPHNLDWSFRGSDGTLSLIEMSYKWNQGDDAKGLPGTFKLGGYYDSATFGDELTTAQYHGDYGLYAMADQLLYKEPSTDKDSARGLSAFLRVGLAPQHDRNIVTFDTEAGLNYAGLLPSRPSDITGIGIAYTKMSQGWQQANEGNSRHEAIIELTHLMVINDHFALQPDVQYIFNPGGLGKLGDALVIGLRFSMSY